MVETQISDLRLMCCFSIKEGFEMAELQNINSFTYGRPKPQTSIQINLALDEFENDGNKK